MFRKAQPAKPLLSASFIQFVADLDRAESMRRAAPAPVRNRNESLKEFFVNRSSK